MKTLGQIIKAKREAKGLLLRDVSAHINIDQAVLSKIETGKRKPTRDGLLKLSKLLDIDREKLLLQFISEKIVYEIINEDCAEEALKLAEKKIKYLKTISNTEL